MVKNEELIELINRTKDGDNESINKLTQLVGDRLLPYIHRLTLNIDVAQDILQEVHLHIIKSINELEQPESFWTWIFIIAKGKVLHHYRDRRRETEVNTRAFQERWNSYEDSSLTGYNFVLRKEMSEAVIQSIAQLSIYHRIVVALRCYENMPYSQIAEVLGCKEMYARVVFLRATKAMKKVLTRRGFSKEDLLLALGLFGTLTLKSEATSATYVSASMLSVGTLAVIISALSSRTAMVSTSLITFLGVLVTTKSFYYGLGIAIISLYILFLAAIANIYKN